MKTGISALRIALYLGHVAAICNAFASVQSTKNQVRTDNTCADPSTAQTFFGAFSTQLTSHNFQIRAAFINSDNDVPQFSWQVQGAIFQAWTTPQISTMPLYVLATPSFDDLMIVNSTSPAGNPPAVAGFDTVQLLAYAYETQICGSVPLFGLAQAANTDHWYTTDEVERDALLSFNSGWADEGVVGYVLPVDDCSCSA